MKKTLYTILLLILSAWLTGMGSSVARRSDLSRNGRFEEPADPDIGNFLLALKTSYESKDIENLLEHVHEDFPARLNFMSAISDHFLSANTLEILFYPGTFLADGDRFSLRTEWHRKVQDRSGVLSKNSGSSEFGIIRTPDGLKLSYIRGQNPFF